jgi:DNA-binding transcriptional LysR family regulator
VAPIARRFVQAYPNVSLTIDLTNRVVDIVAEGYDLAIRTGQLADSRLIGTRIASRKLLTCASLVYLERRGMPGSVDDLAAHDCILGSSVTWHFVDAQGEQTIRPKSRWRCNSGIAVSDAAIEGMGICQLPDFYVIDAVSTGRLVTILDGIRPLDEPIWALYPQRRHLSPKINRFLEMMRDQLPAALNVGKMPPFESVAVGAQTDLRDGANSKLTLNKE